MGYSHWTDGNTVSELVIGDLQLGAAGNHVTATANELNALSGIGTTKLKVIKYIVTAGDQTAGTVNIPIGFTVAGFVCNILRAGKDVTNAAAISSSTTNLVVATNGTSYVLTAGDVVQAFVWA